MTATELPSPPFGALLEAAVASQYHNLSSRFMVQCAMVLVALSSRLPRALEPGGVVRIVRPTRLSSSTNHQPRSSCSDVSCAEGATSDAIHPPWAGSRFRCGSVDSVDQQGFKCKGQADDSSFLIALLERVHASLGFSTKIPHNLHHPEIRCSLPSMIILRLDDKWMTCGNQTAASLADLSIRRRPLSQTHQLDGGLSR